MLFGKKKGIIGLDIGSRALKVAEVIEGKQETVLSKFGTVDIEPGLIEEGMVKNPEQIAEEIRQLFKIYRIKEKNVAISIGGYSIIVKTITVQNMEEEQLQETIQFEAEQYIPFDISDVNLDFQILGENQENPGQMDVLLVAAKREIINDYVNVIQMAGLTPLIVDVDAFALQNIYELNYETENENVALIDIGASKTTLNILRGVQSVLIRDVSLGCLQISHKISQQVGCSVEEAEDYFHDEESDKLTTKDMMDIISSVSSGWCTEIRRALDFFYSTYPGDTIDKIILSGGGAKLSSFRQMLSQETATEVSVINPFRAFSIGDSFDAAFMDEIAPQAAICLGLATRRIDDK